MVIVQSKKSAETKNFSDLEIEALGKQLYTFDLLKNDIARDHRLLESLRFKCQPERHSLMTKAHSQTISWIWDPSIADMEARKLRRWLQHKDGGMFWVSGKPGSGKSMFMKFDVADAEETKKMLSVWANGRKLIVASHYCWWSGTTLQKSQEGLLRTLLYSIIQQCLDLIQMAREERWANGPNTANFGEAESNDTGSWTIEELHPAFDAIAHSPDLRVRFCFFNDGLDEYTGDHNEICDIFINLVKVSSAIKLCLSSRPWNVFEQAFGGKSERIHIHDLTREDIRSFARSIISQNSQWQVIPLESPSGQELINEVQGNSMEV